MSLGYYEYREQRFYDRASAFNEMLLHRDDYGRIQFCFAEDVFRAIDWEQEVPFSIEQLYKLRATQLREKYKYLILYFSGGSDSRQILETFIKYNILIDEIQVAHHSKLTKNLDHSTMMQDSDLKLFLEYDYAVVPHLHRVKQIFPNIVITNIDISDYLHDQVMNRKFNYLGNKNEISLSHQKLYNNIPRAWAYYLSYYNTFVRNHSADTCIIRGFEKPIIDIVGDKITFVFSDMIMHTVKSRVVGEIGVSIEDFFWSADCPLIPIKQSQMLKRVIETDSKFLYKFNFCKKLIKEFDKKPTGGYSPGIMIERLYSSIIYPDWDPNTFAALKPTKNVPEFKLLEKATGESNYALNFMEEYASDFNRLYSPIKNKKQFRGILFTKPYSLGTIK